MTDRRIISLLKKSVASIVAAVIGLLMTGWLVLFALGGIFALVNEKPSTVPLQPPPVQ